MLETGEDVLPMDSVDKRVGELFKFDFDLSGCHLSEDKVSEESMIKYDNVVFGFLIINSSHGYI